MHVKACWNRTRVTWNATTSSAIHSGTKTQLCEIVVEGTLLHFLTTVCKPLTPAFGRHLVFSTQHYQTFDLQMLGNIYVRKNRSDEEGDHGGFCELNGMVMILLKISLSKSSILLSYDSCQNNVSYQTMQCNVISILAYSYIGRGRRTMMSALIMVRMVQW